MTSYYSTFITENEASLPPAKTNGNFSAKEICWTTDNITDKRLYQQIVFNVLTQPKQLNFHVQRIHFTYARSMTEPLYAALIDLLHILGENGKALSKNMILSSRSQLTKPQFNILASFFKHRDSSRLIGNNFSLFTRGLVGRCDILTVKVQPKNIDTRDPLDIAHDYIEYSQLDQAIDTLEKGILEFPERQDLQTSLLELYKLTKNKNAFFKMRDLLIEDEFELSFEWQQLTDFFTGPSDEE